MYHFSRTSTFLPFEESSSRVFTGPRDPFRSGRTYPSHKKGFHGREGGPVDDERFLPRTRQGWYWYPKGQRSGEFEPSGRFLPPVV